MTLTAGHGSERTDAWLERRRPAKYPRRSWAAPEPFVRRATEHNSGDDALRALPWVRTATGYQRTTVAMDTVLAGLGVGASAALGGAATGSALLLAGVAALALPTTVAALRGYERHNMGDGPGEFQVLLRAAVLLAALVMALAYLTPVTAPREVVVVGVPVLAAAACTARYVHRRFLHARRNRGQAMMRTIVVGDTASVADVVHDLSVAPYHGYLVIGSCLSDVVPESVAEVPVPTLGALADVPQVVSDYAVSVVVVAGNALSGQAVRRLSWALRRAGAELVVAPGLVEVAQERVSVHPTAGLSLLRLEIEPPRRRMVAKAVMDRVLGVLALLLVAPVIAVAALAVRVTSPGPAFYTQTRVGVDGREFRIWKLRSMYRDADRRRAELLERSDRDGLMFKMARDPRVTPVGRVLRRFSLDELPQFFNVVRGDMSLVGPRPPLREEVLGYHDAVHQRLRVKPGITGLWQVSGRADLPWDESIRLDLRYVDNWSVTMDLMILWKTFRAVVTGAGAY
ncbi:sugar transferase [Cellulomonas fimi]|uniref:Exopolysaccharide biosynthesis polyprenyl glycosylphosphotransferase n=1 Tax=Cellulomonas fimi (strain ATCC 484 / DSM 20113 / JCM 1341 / CCUG 24087 / LMG 16345 / NBRC 15513 / NCIMB 8980 / NCTC 7547 / NRS-133) TaxID=590998 RepID=F4GZ44_CELFA|nr:sugar transferase [Cellulomonas fimi]AEE47160.1 exopolysaccharide biosynthesis polyprenyl glycosylphosphotransferase [Cellulomonas fimi ATCC 484]NNH07703.1 sugar transferase [Cellulomonas fimi]VEH35444.1 Putative colanic biosynthesis UDP-glucose lipid carrier transferase [Cellulomonas fimi]